MKTASIFSKALLLCGLLGGLAACGSPRAVMLPLQYPDGSPVRSVEGEPVMAGYQTYGSATHANATALYEQPKPPTCATCARVGAVVTEPSTLRQATGVLGTAATSASAVMIGMGAMDYGEAAREGKLGTNISQGTYVSQRASSVQKNNQSNSNNASATSSSTSSASSNASSSGSSSTSSESVPVVVPVAAPASAPAPAPLLVSAGLASPLPPPAPAPLGGPALGPPAPAPIPLPAPAPLGLY